MRLNLKMSDVTSDPWVIRGSIPILLIATGLLVMALHSQVKMTAIMWFVIVSVFFFGISVLVLGTLAARARRIRAEGRRRPLDRSVWRGWRRR